MAAEAGIFHRRAEMVGRLKTCTTEGIEEQSDDTFSGANPRRDVITLWNKQDKACVSY
ncbi:hypothetical protein [Sphingobium cloacae]|uniref:hypothetical protein n=1 Tax=Sphingobium cloacae TaxID=120107 RepID=UPI001E2C3672|nr:hypothetical protein [Sphingobium cloacae]